MYLHIGADHMIAVQSIVGIFDFDATIEQTPDTLDFIRKEEEREKVELISPDIPRSYVVTIDRVYLSPIATTTLKKRLNQKIHEAF